MSQYRSTAFPRHRNIKRHIWNHTDEETKKNCNRGSFQNEPQCVKTYLWTYMCTCAFYDNSDQPAHSRSLIRIFTWRTLDGQGCKVSLCGQRRLSRVHGCAMWFESSLSAYVKRYVFSRNGLLNYKHQLLCFRLDYINAFIRTSRQV